MRDLILKNVSFSYPGGFLAVDDVSMEIKGGENVAIVGQNGAGKTTTVKMMNGLLRPSKGDVLIGDMNTESGRSDFPFYCGKRSAVWTKDHEAGSGGRRPAGGGSAGDYRNG